MSLDFKCVRIVIVCLRIDATNVILKDAIKQWGVKNSLELSSDEICDHDRNTKDEVGI